MSLSDWALGTTLGQWTVLFSFGTLLIVAGTISYRLTPGTQATPARTLGESFWASYTLWADVGTQTGFTWEDPGACLFVAVVFSFLGFVYNLALLGLVVDMIRGQLAHWKWAKSRIAARNHVLILGWGDKSLFLLDELVAADQNTQVNKKHHHRLRRKIVILAEHSVHDMQQEIKTYFTSRFKSAGGFYKGIEYRRGDPTDQAELLKVSAPLADDILIMSFGQGEFSGSDQRVLQTLLSLAALHLEQPLRGDIFAEMQTQDGLLVMHDIFPKAEGIIARQAVNRMGILRALVSSVGFAYLEMVSFKRGSEMYIVPVPKALVGTPFLESTRLFKDAVIIGVRSAPPETKDHTHPKDIQGLVPAVYRPFRHGDELVMLATERAAATNLGIKDLIAQSDVVHMEHESHSMAFQDLRTGDGQLRLGPSVVGPKVILLLGCPVDFPDLLEMLDCYLEKGSEVHVLSERSALSREDLMRKGWGTSDVTKDVRQFLKRVAVTHHFGSPTQRWALRQLPLDKADFAIIVAETLTKQDSADAADSRSLTTVITLRSMMPKEKGKKKCKVVTELVHPKSQLVVQGNGTVRRHGSFVYSTLLETGVFALASEDKNLYEILMKILSPDSDAGHIAVARTSDFIRNVEALSFYDLHERILRQSNCILMGWRRSSEQYPKLNPDEKALPLDWDPSKDDELILFCPTEEHASSGEPRRQNKSQSDTSSLRAATPSPEPPMVASITEAPTPALPAPACMGNVRDLPVLPGTMPITETEESDPFLDDDDLGGRASPTSPMSPTEELARLGSASPSMA